MHGVKDFLTYFIGKVIEVVNEADNIIISDPLESLPNCPANLSSRASLFLNLVDVVEGPGGFPRRLACCKARVRCLCRTFPCHGPLLWTFQRSKGKSAAVIVL